MRAMRFFPFFRVPFLAGFLRRRVGVTFSPPQVPPTFQDTFISILFCFAQPETVNAPQRMNSDIFFPCSPLLNFFFFFFFDCACPPTIVLSRFRPPPPSPRVEEQFLFSRPPHFEASPSHHLLVYVLANRRCSISGTGFFPCCPACLESLGGESLPFVCRCTLSPARTILALLFPNEFFLPPPPKD